MAVGAFLLGTAGYRACQDSAASRKRREQAIRRADAALARRMHERPGH